MADLCTMTDYDLAGGRLTEAACEEPALVAIAVGCVNEHVDVGLACSGCLAELQMELAGDEPADCSRCGQPVLITIRELEPI